VPTTRQLNSCRAASELEKILGSRTLISGGRPLPIYDEPQGFFWTSRPVRAQAFVDNALGH